MIDLTIEEIIKATRGRLFNPGANLKEKIEGVSVDSRSLVEKNLFVPLEGERVDGHKFIREAIEKKANAVLVSKEKVSFINFNRPLLVPIILVQDTKTALVDLAKWWRKEFKGITIALTGSNGKTTTKDMIASVLSQKYEVAKSAKSYNTLIGVPLTIFELNSQSKVLVTELGMNQPGEIGFLTQLVQPDFGLVTNIGPAHLEAFGSLEKIAQAKFELVDNLKEDKTAILNIDDQFCQKRKEIEKRKVITFGVKTFADFKADGVRMNDNGEVSFSINHKISVNLKLLGEHNVYNALSAFAVGELLFVPREKIKEALENYQPQHLRMELLEMDGIKIINDSYNSNPASMDSALKTLKEIKTSGRKIAVLGDMLELGEQAEKLHKEVGEKVFQKQVDLLLTVGELASSIVQGALNSGMKKNKVFSFKDNQEASFYLKENLKKGDLVLVKGSRRMKMEEIVSDLMDLYKVRRG